MGRSLSRALATAKRVGGAFWTGCDGATAIEYTLICAAMAAVLVGAVSALRDPLVETLTFVANHLGL
ncbi:Flp family type IVb pilin [Jiella sp. MQZ9-1]|uniref:Flp family type IVb pilin n=1 Tax=Jiella flava TaxID=2816857 RepID=A0A939FXG5_9HYPH|nr:Flp family type IVb pilin [Jiella flava]MBO0661960.1 Flp family type IVb pilin [Jiella flava]MCD2470713.1 Flp family type IVb pilin [Jiella flava]